MANIVKTYSFVNGQPADATQVNQNFDDIIDGVGDISAAGHALIDDANAAAQLATLGTAAYSEGMWTPVLNDFTIVGSAPAAMGTYKRIGNMVFILCAIEAGVAGNTSIANGGGAAINGLPFGVTVMVSLGPVVNSTTGANLGIAIVSGTHILMPVITAQSNTIITSLTYNA